MDDIKILEKVYDSSCLKKDANNLSQIMDDKLSDINSPNSKKSQDLADKLYKSFEHLRHDISDYDYGSWQTNISPTMKRFMMYAIAFSDKVGQKKSNQLTEEQIKSMFEKYETFFMLEYDREFYEKLRNNEELSEFARKQKNIAESKKSLNDKIQTIHALVNKCGFSCSPLQISRELAYIGTLFELIDEKNLVV